ncbi:MAG: transposase [Candidatus Cloacimonadales bacterium]
MITDVFITLGNVHDSIPYLSRLDYQLERFGFPVQAVGIDAGYNTSAICKGIIERDIFGVIGRRRFGGKKSYFRKSKFEYIDSEDVYICPNKCKLKYKLTMRQGYSIYESNENDCLICPLRAKCVTSKAGKKMMTMHVWEHYKEQIMKNNKSESGKNIYKKRKETVERSFANSKQLIWD